MTNITNEQLEAWAGCTQKDPEPITQDMWNDRMALFSEAKQHAPKLAAALLAERKAREAEVGALKAAIQDIAENWKWWDEDRYDRCSSVVGDSIAEAERALKGPTP